MFTSQQNASFGNPRFLVHSLTPLLTYPISSPSSHTRSSTLYHIPSQLASSINIHQHLDTCALLVSTCFFYAVIFIPSVAQSPWPLFGVTPKQILSLKIVAQEYTSFSDLYPYPRLGSHSFVCLYHHYTRSFPICPVHFGAARSQTSRALILSRPLLAISYLLPPSNPSTDISLVPASLTHSIKVTRSFRARYNGCCSGQEHRVYPREGCHRVRGRSR